MIPEIIIPDRNGTPITNGCRVRIHHTTYVREATVVEAFADWLTDDQPGFWVEIRDKRVEIGDKRTEMVMSYICEVIQ